METKRTARERASLQNWWMLTAGALGGALAIGAMLWFSAFSTFPLAAIPFATSIVLVMGSPEAEPAQPRALIGGHLVSTLVGLIVLQIAGPQPWAAAVAVGLSMLAMRVTVVSSSVESGSIRSMTTRSKRSRRSLRSASISEVAMTRSMP